MDNRKKKPTKHMVTVGTHVPMATKVGLQALAESLNKSVYEYLQERIVEDVEDFYRDINLLKQRNGEPPTAPLEDAVEDDGSDLLA